MTTTRVRDWLAATTAWTARARAGSDVTTLAEGAAYVREGVSLLTTEMAALRATREEFRQALTADTVYGDRLAAAATSLANALRAGGPTVGRLDALDTALTAWALRHARAVPGTKVERL